MVCGDQRENGHSISDRNRQSSSTCQGMVFRIKTCRICKKYVLKGIPIRQTARSVLFRISTKTPVGAVAIPTSHRAIKSKCEF